MMLPVEWVFKRASLVQPQGCREPPPASRKVIWRIAQLRSLPSTVAFQNDVTELSHHSSGGKRDPPKYALLIQASKLGLCWLRLGLFSLLLSALVDRDLAAM